MIHPTLALLRRRGEYVPPRDSGSFGAWRFPDGSALLMTAWSHEHSQFAQPGTHFINDVTVTLPGGAKVLDTLDVAVSFQSVEAAIVYMAGAGCGPLRPVVETAAESALAAAKELIERQREEIARGRAMIDAIKAGPAGATR
jgi:hypothetical protein